LILLVGTGIFLTIRLKGIQFRLLFYALRLAFSRERDGDGDISHFAALMTALASTIGVGNIAGVSTAVALGGPGAVFWMWVTALFGMATKYGEGLLAVKYRKVNGHGEISGGPMYYLEKGLGKKWLGVCFAFFGALAAFGIGNMVQANTTASAVSEVTSRVNPCWFDRVGYFGRHQTHCEGIDHLCSGFCISLFWRGLRCHREKFCQPG
jgi:AGCS family alanine or glycine:cation symporter